MRRRDVLMAGVTALSLHPTLPATAAERAVRIGMSATVTSLDPHSYSAAPNNTIAFNIFEALVALDANGVVSPSLAVSWEGVSDSEWRFRLREGVRWHDGSAFTADDVMFSLRRAQKGIEGAPGGFSGYLNTIEALEAPDPLTVRIRTTRPTPSIPIFMSYIAIVQKAAAEGANSRDFNSGKVMIGTGPYKFVRYLPGELVEFTRNDAWWGGRPEWDRVTYRVVPDLAVRTTALLAGDLDIVEAPAAADLERLKADRRIAVYTKQSTRVAYVNPIYQPVPDADAATDRSGKRIEPTPFADPRVRRALSIAINRVGIAERVMFGTVEPTGQLLPTGVYSYTPDIAVPPHDPAKARELLAEAGYPNGFQVTLTAANDRVPYNIEVTQAVAQMWARIGVTTKVNAVPTSIYTELASRQRTAAYVGSLGNNTMEAGATLSRLLATYNRQESKGILNWSRYSNPQLDAMVDVAMSTIDDRKREQILQDATRLISEDVALIPLFHFLSLWAARAEFVYEPRADGLTLAKFIHFAGK